MAVEGATEALVAAFFFGIVLNAASAALVLYLRGYGLASAFRDSQRLVLVLFLLSAALWAQTDFITILLDTSSSSTPCQVGVIISTVFDQFARFAIEQFLLWGLNRDTGSKPSIMQLVPQVLVLARFLAGAVFIGFTRPQTDDFCVATTSATPVGIMVTALDGVIIMFLIIRAYSAGGAAKQNNVGDGAEADRSRSLMAVLMGLVFWTGTSVPLLLGIRTVSPAIRTALPAGGLLVVIALVAGGAGSLLTARPSNSRPPEAPSPRRINISRDISTSDTNYPPSRFEDLKEAAIRSSTTFVNPREAPRFKDETAVDYPFGMVAGPQGEPMPPLPAMSGPVQEGRRALPHKKSMFHPVKGKIAISGPILQENAGQNAFGKIPVMDLQAAAMAERERRARMQEEENKPVGRSAGIFNGMTPEEALQRGVSLKRKEVASVSNRESVGTSLLQVADTASSVTTSAQFSPGGDEARRRSPRQSMQKELELELARTELPVKVPEPTKARAESPQNRRLTMQQPLLKNSIRPSRMLPPSPKTPPPEPTKTPLQRRPTIGLPSNPRARGLQIADEPGTQNKTILFVNNIEYNDPIAVQAIMMKGASNTAAKPDPYAEALETSSSVVNRPRPIPRKAMDSPAQASPAQGHRRSKSFGSVVGRKSILDSAPGSPTRLPPLPSLPRSATMPIRPQPNDTKSMTFEEKVTLMFPVPPSSGNALKRRSSVPDVPRIPISYLEMESSPSEPYDRRRSNRTTKASTARTESVLEVDEILWRPGMMAVNTTVAGGSNWLRAFGDGQAGGQSNKATSGKRGSSPIIPAVPVRASAWTETTYDRDEDDDATNWSPINSPQIAAQVQIAQALGLPRNLGIPVRPDVRGSQFTMGDNRSRETLPFILDTSTLEQEDLDGSTISNVETVVAPEPPTWHRRVGDECPTFSARPQTRSRKMSPPPPLSLNNIAPKKIIPVHVELSPLESPQHAIRQIQAQLTRLERAEASPQSALRRIALLEDLEREMGQQEEHWEEIKHDIGRDSLSSMQTVSPMGRNSRHASVASTINMARDSTSTLWQSIKADRRASRNARMRASGNGSKPRLPDPSVRNSGSPQLTKWQKRLTEAQMDYMDAQLFRGPDFNVAQLSKAQLASPTPPDSDEFSEDETPTIPSIPKHISAESVSAETHHQVFSLWTPPTHSSAPAGHLWTAAVSKPALEIEAALPGLSVRPAQRKEAEPLEIESLQLWRKPYSTTNRSSSGLWRPVWASAAPPAEPIARPTSKTPATPQKPPRPLTQRPPRRNKRMTLLPDILESPEPLPDKRGTLGIFQFPWGEKSDTAMVQPRPSMYMAMPGTMTTGGPSVGMARQLEPTEYSSSFFDDYDDDENDNDDETDSDEENEDDDDDDGFDDTTLWEIASLLKTDAVPSRNSLLPPAQPGSVMYEYMDELASDEEGGSSSRQQSIVIGLADDSGELAFNQQRDSATLDSSTLLMLEGVLEGGGVTAPLNTPGIISSGGQAPEATAAPGLARTTPGHTHGAQRAETAREQGSAGLWYPHSKADQPSDRKGLFVVPESSRAGRRGSPEAEPAAKYISRPPPRGVEHKPLDQLTSTKLWTPAVAKDKKHGQRDWISGGSVVVVKKQHGSGRIHATVADWKAALREAVAASYPRRRAPLKRVIAASPAEWDAALQHALALSFNPAVRHPVFLAQSLLTPSASFHPAATGYTSTAPAATKLAEPAVLSRRDTLIQAQIEALEQERLFVERAAQEDYRRRQAFSTATMAVLPAEPAAAVMMLPAGAETVQDLQRRMSRQIRQSLVFSKAKPTTVTTTVTTAPPAPINPPKPHLHLTPSLWTPAPCSPSTSPTGLWSATTPTAYDLSGAWAEEDMEAARQRARRRRVVQRKQRRQEILGQIWAVERGLNPFVDFAGMGLWIRGGGFGGGLVKERRGAPSGDWLGAVCVRKAGKGVVLRY
ncbi:hypothetical protein C8A05DRAFT_18496 [Staphylotrichum tortipilum]|uniref:Uncharacterized protein n=1 Tax=Staphylotrichum tortipilum TaxID=2831512 RepID=A0AAN6MF73_9PEZI|nr:hypothetical protein C8A05DRAFT_18496 [Staphylotrichum longicolle]